VSGAVLFHRTKPPRRHTGASDREHGQVNGRHDADRAAQKQKGPTDWPGKMADQRVENTVRSGLPERRRAHFNVTRKRPEFRARTRAHASSRLRRLLHRRGNSTTAHNAATSMIRMPATARKSLMRRVHSDRPEPRHECTHYRLHGHARRVQSPTISSYDSDSCGHRVQRPRLRQVVDGARSRSRILSMRNH
jgi:hypothetical protein